MSYKCIIAVLFISKCSTTFCYCSETEQNCSNYNQNIECIIHQCDPRKDYSDELTIHLIEEREKQSKKLRLSRTDKISPEHLNGESASYLEGYIQALIDDNYYELNVLVFVDKYFVVYLYNLPSDERIKNSIIAFVKDLPDVKNVKDGKIDQQIKRRLNEKQPIRQMNGVWFPESTVIFQPLIANPREPTYSVAYRSGDKILANNQAAVSLGDIFPIFRWFDVFPMRGDLQISIAGCVWANFDIKPIVHPRGEWAELVTTDYIISVPITYAFDKWAFRLRAYHISSHLGDEFIINHSDVLRVNPSFEAVDFFTSYQATSGLRLYVGPGIVVNSDDSFPMKFFYFEYGLEWRIVNLRHHYHKLYGSPFIAIDMQHWQVNSYKTSATIQLGYEWSKLQGAGRKVRVFGEYHNGYSEGQFFNKMTDYFAMRASWGF